MFLAVFSTINHGILLQCLRSTDLEALFCAGFIPYWWVHHSTWFAPPSCTTHGGSAMSILSLMLFNIHVKLLMGVTGSAVKYQQCADSTQIYLSFPSNSREAVDSM